MKKNNDSKSESNDEQTTIDSAFVPLIVKRSSLPEFDKRDLLRQWWHDLLRNYGRFACYSIVLVLPSDREMTNYLTQYGNELHLISGQDCMMIIFSEAEYKPLDFNEISLSDAINDHISEGYSIKIARMFNIDITDFPCLLIFNDIRSTEHFIVKLNNLTAEQISARMRDIFTTIHKANSLKESPLKAMERHRKKENRTKAKQNIISNLRSFSGKTFEMAINALIDERIK